MIQLQGSFGDVTYYKRNDGSYGFKRKSVISKERIATDPAFLNLRKTGIEFNNAALCGKNLRGAFASLMTNADNKVVSRLLKVMKNVIKADTTNNIGERRVASGDLMLLQDFDFNRHSPLSAALRAPYSTTITRSSGTVAISIPAFVPSVLLAIPQNATHFKIMAAAQAIDFTATKVPVANTTSSTYQTADSNLTTAISLSLTVPTATTDPIFVVMGVQFYTEINGNQNPVSNSAFNAISIIEVNV